MGHKPSLRGLFLLLTFAGSLALPCYAFKKAGAWPVRDYLPPVASINGPISEESQSKTDQVVEPISLSAIASPATLHTSPRVQKLGDSSDHSIQEEHLQPLQEIQAKVDAANLERLWQATVEKNPVIRFSLEKLAMPVDTEKKHSSQFLSKTLSLLISGATLGATMIPGASAYQNMGSMAAGNALQNIVHNDPHPPPGTLSPTEQIQLAGLIDDLKMKLIHNYQDYKTTLLMLVQAKEMTMRNNNLYSKALASKNDLSMMSAGAAYYQALLNETTLRQKTKLYRLELERLAGDEIVSHLKVAIQLPDTPVLDTTVMNTTVQIMPSRLGQPGAQPSGSEGGQAGSQLGSQNDKSKTINASKPSDGKTLSDLKTKPTAKPVAKTIAKSAHSKTIAGKTNTNKTKTSSQSADPKLLNGLPSAMEIPPQLTHDSVISSFSSVDSSPLETLLQSKENTSP